MKEAPTAYSLLIMHRDVIYAVRDPYGNRPLCIGRLIPVSDINDKGNQLQKEYNFIMFFQVIVLLADSESIRYMKLMSEKGLGKKEKVIVFKVHFLEHFWRSATFNIFNGHSYFLLSENCLFIAFAQLFIWVVWFQWCSFWLIRCLIWARKS